MKRLQWDYDAWQDYVYWQTQDKKTLKRINILIKDIGRNPFDGIGKPEPLKGELSGFWSRRIDEKNRLVFLFYFRIGISCLLPAVNNICHLSKR